MTYAELKQWFIDWLIDKDKPVSLYWNSCVSVDVREPIHVAINRVDGIENPKQSAIAKADKNNLLEIKKAIENKQHDISIFGYKVN